MSCLNNANTLTCSQKNPVFSVTWNLNTPSNSNQSPTLTASAFGEKCSQADYCSLIDNIRNAGKSDPQSGNINLGLLGSFPPSTFWPVLIAILLTLAGIGYVAYSRNKVSNSNSGNDEEAMTQSKNTAGWFGEKVPDLKTPTTPRTRENRSTKLSGSKSKSTSRDSWAPKTLLEKIEASTGELDNPTSSTAPRQSSNKSRKSQAKQARLERSKSVDDDKPLKDPKKQQEKKRDSLDSSSDDEIDMSRVVKRVPLKDLDKNSKNSKSRSADKLKNSK